MIRNAKNVGRPKRRIRRGVAIVLVLGMLAMTLALSYASLRGQATVAKLADNAGRGDAARQAAESGVYAALAKMSNNTWAGVATPLTSYIDANSWYEVTFETGDAQLTPADPEYGEYAFRVTINSTGYSTDPGQPTVRSIHKVEVVVQLARRKLYDAPANWNSLEPYTVYQWAIKQNYIQQPVRVEGSLCFLGPVNIASDYPFTFITRDLYLGDLKDMFQAGGADYRPFNGPMVLAYSRQTAENQNLIASLGVTTVDITAATTAPVTAPVSVVNYKLYPGGKSYTPPVLQTTYGSSVQNLNLAPDPINNPLGIYRSRGALTVNNNVNITGTIISENTTPEVQVYGTNVVFQAPNLAPLEDSTTTYQLPATIIKDDLRLHSDSGVTLRGLHMVFDEFELKQGSATTQFTLTGQLMGAGVSLRGRDNWVLNSGTWLAERLAFEAQLLDPTPVPYFPTWMQQRQGLNPQPLLTLKRDSSGVKYHWQNWAQPVYQKDPTDPGLRWNLIRWVDGV